MTGLGQLTEHAMRRSALGVTTALLIVLVLSHATPPPADSSPVTLRELALCLDPNVATAAELALLPGIGPKLADNIVSYRVAATRRPAFRRADDLDAVPRIGPITVDRLRPHLRFDSRSPASCGSATSEESP